MAHGKNQPDDKDKAEVSVGAVETSDQLVVPTDDIPDVHPMPKHVRVNRNNGCYRVQSGTPRKGEAAKTKPRENENLNDDHFLKITSPGGKFFDAWEELSIDSAPHSSLRALEQELREIRLSLLMEIEKWKQAEEALHNMHNCWRRLIQLLELNIGADYVEELSQQVYTARFVSEVLERGIAKAEAEAMGSSPHNEVVAPKHGDETNSPHNEVVAPKHGMLDSSELRVEWLTWEREEIRKHLKEVEEYQIQS
ncbi:hypothetical protein SAY86_020500 [Trapa natans]|uniref:Uncharacterized protein n=1 Tax=Trapa natans TaxID=22666 RepID=A0AAN7R6K7_TRANT|nr:hypothetical protein SAY86_020500 [Trapa natans]